MQESFNTKNKIIHWTAQQPKYTSGQKNCQALK
jgi:hypothetical protein